MKLPKWFVMIWWVILLLLLTWFLYGRFSDLKEGKASAVDALAFIIWIALALAPIFQEVSIFGVKLKQQLEDLKQHLNQQVANIQSDIRTSIRTEFNPQIVFPSPPPDSRLPDLEERVLTAVQKALAEHGVAPEDYQVAELQVTGDVQVLFTARYNIERELRRLWSSRIGTEQSRRPVPVFQITRDLVAVEFIDPQLAGAIREVYSVCSPAIHGEAVTEKQIAFVREVAPQLILALRGID